MIIMASRNLNIIVSIKLKNFSYLWNEVFHGTCLKSKYNQPQQVNDVPKKNKNSVQLC